MSHDVSDPGCAHRSVLSVVILSDIRFFREGLVEVLGRHSGLSVLGDAAELGEAFEAFLALLPDIVLIDTGFPQGLSAVRLTRLLAPGACVVALALAETGHNVVVWAEAGAMGYIPRTAGLGEMVAALQSVVRGEQACSSAVSGYLLRRIAAPADPNRGSPQLCGSPLLTKRELEVVELIDAGLSNKEIARHLNIGIATTKTHVHNILEKLRLGRRSQAAIWIREQLSQSAPAARSGRWTSGSIAESRPW
jgi:DNA-binding NarL/FixJ family response regulator